MFFGLSFTHYDSKTVKHDVKNDIPIAGASVGMPLTLVLKHGYQWYVVPNTRNYWITDTKVSRLVSSWQQSDDPLKNGKKKLIFLFKLLANFILIWSACMYFFVILPINLKLTDAEMPKQMLKLSLPQFAPLIL